MKSLKSPFTLALLLFIFLSLSVYQGFAQGGPEPQVEQPQLDLGSEIPQVDDEPSGGPDPDTVQAGLTSRCEDIDGDGAWVTVGSDGCSQDTPIDCDDGDSNIRTASDGTCDGDDDGFIDTDAFISQADSSPDCNDNSSVVYPGANELCDGQDNDCDGVGDSASCTDSSGCYQSDGTWNLSGIDKDSDLLCSDYDCDDSDRNIRRYPGYDCNSFPSLVLQTLRVSDETLLNSFEAANIQATRDIDASGYELYPDGPKLPQGKEFPISSHVATPYDDISVDKLAQVTFGRDSGVSIGENIEFIGNTGPIDILGESDEIIVEDSDIAVYGDIAVLSTSENGELTEESGNIFADSIGGVTIKSAQSNALPDIYGNIDRSASVSCDDGTFLLSCGAEINGTDEVIDSIYQSAENTCTAEFRVNTDLFGDSDLLTVYAYCFDPDPLDIDARYQTVDPTFYYPY